MGNHMDFKFQRTRIDKIPEYKILEELEKAARHFNYVEFGRRDFARFADISDHVVMRHFGTWRKGLEALRSRLKEKGMDLSLRPHAPQQIYPDKELFSEMELVWQKVGQRPSRIQLASGFILTIKFHFLKVGRSPSKICRHCVMTVILAKAMVL